MSTFVRGTRLLALVFLGSVLAADCSNGPTPPTDTSAAPKITCPPPPASTVSPDGVSALVSYGTPTVIGGKVPILTNCTPVSGTFFPVGSNTVTCKTTDDLNRTDTCAFSVVVTRSPNIGLTQFVAFGDSITWGEDGTNFLAFSTAQDEGRAPLIVPHVQLPTFEQYPAKLLAGLQARYIAQAAILEVANQGRQGESLTNPTAPTALTRFSSVTLGKQSVLLMEGANDLGNIGGAIDVLRQMVQDAKRRGVRPYLATIPPEEEGVTVPRRGRPIETMQLNDRIRVLAAAEGVTLVDVFQAFPPGNLIAQGLIGFDGLHPTGAGYTIIAQKFFDTLKATLETSP